MMAANNERQYQALAEVIAAPELLNDPRFKDWPTRKSNVDDLRGIIEGKLVEADGADLEARLDAAGVPASRVRDMAASLDDPQIAHRGLMTAFDADSGGLGQDYALVGAPFSFADSGPAVTSPPPRVGQDTIDVLREAGLSEAEITSATS
jgi:crotonobetainyl-CoA:carnitine CoA-transferase CaiB-like acyl-CoA transferase